MRKASCLRLLVQDFKDYEHSVTVTMLHNGTSYPLARYTTTLYKCYLHKFKTHWKHLADPIWYKHHIFLAHAQTPWSPCTNLSQLAEIIIRSTFPLLKVIIVLLQNEKVNASYHLLLWQKLISTNLNLLSEQFLNFTKMESTKTVLNYLPPDLTAVTSCCCCISQDCHESAPFHPSD